MSSNVLRVRQPHIRVTSYSLGVTLLFHYLMTRWSGNLGPLFSSLPQSLSTSSLINPFRAQAHRSTMEGQGSRSESPTRRVLLKQGPKMLLEPTQDQQTSADKRTAEPAQAQHQLPAVAADGHRAASDVAGRQNNISWDNGHFLEYFPCFCISAIQCGLHWPPVNSNFQP